MQEIWKSIQGFENTYMISNLGNVKSLSRPYTKGKLIKPHKHKRGYLYCCLSQNGKVYNRRIHILVAKAFIPNPNNLPEINHKDENKSNNIVTNLEWCTKVYNIQYGSGIDRRSKAVIGLKNNKIIYKFKSTAEAGRKGFNHHHISSCCLGKRKTHKGLNWKYIENIKEIQDES